MTIASRSAAEPVPDRGFAAIVLYPLQSPSLTTLLALSLSMLLTIAPLMGIVFQCVIWAAAYHYALEAMERTANGSMVAPEFATEPDGMGWTLLVLQGLFLASLWWFDSRVESAASRWLGMAAIAFVQPAMTLTVAMNRDIGAAFNPGRVLRVIAGIGAAYALLVAAGIGLNALQSVVGSVVAGGRAYVLVVVSGIGLGGAQQIQGALFGNWLTAVLGQMLAGFVWFYAIVLYFHVLGQMVHARRNALGFVPTPLATLRPEDRHKPLLQRVERLVDEQDFAGAAQLMERCLSTEPHASPAMHARYRELLEHIGDQPGLLAHARARIDALLVAGSEREALALLRESLARDPRFRPSSGERTTQLSGAAERLGQHDLALALLLDFPLHHPRSPDIPANAMSAARILVERHTDIVGARALLQAGIDCMLPGHPQYAEMMAKRNELDMLTHRIPGNTPANPAGNR